MFEEPIPISQKLFDKIKQTNCKITEKKVNGITIYTVIYPSISYTVYIDTKLKTEFFTEIIKTPNKMFEENE